MRRSALLLLAASSLLPLMTRAAERPRYGGVLRVETVAEWNGANPLARLLFENLTYLDASGNPQPQLATTWESQNEGRRWQFWLRRNIRFHDGTPLTANAVANSLMAESRPRSWSALRVVGDSVVFEFTEPRPQFAAELALVRYGIDHAVAGGSPVGTGPFRQDEARPGTVVLRANDDYWGGRPFLDSIELRADRSTRDQMQDFDLDRADLVEAGPEQARRLQQQRTRSTTSQPVELIAATVAPGRLQDARVRQALALAIDRSAIRNVFLQRQGEVSGGLLPSWISGYAFLLPHNRDLPRAQEIVRGLGYSPTLNIGTDRRDPLLQLIAERIALNARDAGLHVTALPAAAPDLLVTRLPLPSTNPAVALAQMDGQDRTQDSPQARYDQERDFLAQYTLVPLVYLPQTYAIGPRVRNWMSTPGGAPLLENAWLDSSARAGTSTGARP